MRVVGSIKNSSTSPSPRKSRAQPSRVEFRGLNPRHLLIITGASLFFLPLLSHISPSSPTISFSLSALPLFSFSSLHLISLLLSSPFNLFPFITHSTRRLRTAEGIIIISPSSHSSQHDLLNLSLPAHVPILIWWVLLSMEIRYSR